jgi:hypothetical protein
MRENQGLWVEEQILSKYLEIRVRWCRKCCNRSLVANYALGLRIVYFQTFGRIYRYAIRCLETIGLSEFSKIS